MKKKPKLKVDWCSYKAAKYAVMHWHYSKSMPAGKLVKIGVWEDNRFIGSVLFGRAANRNIGKPFGLKMEECCELVRIALNEHLTPVSKIVSISIKMLKQLSPDLKLIVSFADSNQNHLGVVYQASNWIYCGKISHPYIELYGEKCHSRSISNKYGTCSIKWLRKNIDTKARYVRGQCKYKYLYPLDRKIRKRIESLAKPYPKENAAC